MFSLLFVTPSVQNYWEVLAFLDTITFTMYLDIMYMQVHSKSFISKKAKTFYNLEWR